MTVRTTWSEIRRGRAGARVRAGYLAAGASYELAERVRTLRRSRGLSQQQLADRMGTKQSVISRLESGGMKPTFSTLERIGAALSAEMVVTFTDLPRARRRVKSLSSRVTRPR